MRIQRLRLAAVVFAAVTAVRVPASMAGPVEDFDKLVAEMEAAADTYFDAFDAWIEKHGYEALEKAEPKDLPPDTRPGVLKKMDKLAASVAGSSDAARLAVATYGWAMELGDELALTWLHRIAKDHPNAPGLKEALLDVPYAVEYIGTPEAWVAPLRRLAEATRDDETKAIAYYAVGRALMIRKRLTDAHAVFEKAIAAAPKGDTAESAKGMIYEIEHLQIGMVAPDFSAKRMGTGQLKISDFRGKAVLLNFWASW